MYDLIREKYRFALLTSEMISMLNIKQVENEGMLDYIKQFKQSCDINESHFGTDLLDKFLQKTHEHQDETDEEQRRSIWEVDGIFDDP